jgi:hypothetical protein
MGSRGWQNPGRHRPDPPRVCRTCGNNLPAYFLSPHACEQRNLDMTTGDIDAFLGASDVPRDHYGRPLIKAPDGGKGKAYTRCTTFVGCLEDTFNLAKWQQRMVALGLSQRPDLMVSVTAHHDDKRELDKVCEAAKEAAAASSAATVGTALHRICERLDRGEKITVPDAYKADIAAYQRATKGIRWTHIEAITVHDDLKVAGTPDRIGAPAGTPARVYDLKTGSIHYGLGKIAMQLAMYARSQAYNVDTGERTPLTVDLDTATIIHLPAGKGECTLVDVDIAAGWEGVLLAQQVRAWRARKDLARPAAPAPEPAEDLRLLIAGAPDVETLRELWQEHAAQWTDALTALAGKRKAALAKAAA